MNAAIKAAIHRPQSYNCPLLNTAFFHSTTVLERKRSSSSSGCLFSDKNAHKKNKSKKFLKEHQEKIRRAVEEVKRIREEAIKKAREEKEKDRSKFKTPRKHPNNQKYFEYVIRSLFGEYRRDYDESIHCEEERRWWYNSSWYSNYSKNSRNSWRSKYRFYEGKEGEEQEEDDYSSRKSSDSVSDSILQASHRQTLGLSPYGPLRLEDVKQAYRICALQWHPDRHTDSTKTMAEIKFKICNVAYNYLIDKLRVN